MSEPGDLLKAAMYAWKTEKDRKRALNLAQQVIQRYPDSREVDMAQVIVTKLKPNPEWNESDDVPQVAQDESSFGGQFLRFVGMAMIMVAVIVGLVGFLGVWQLIFFALIIGLAGAALHYKGRKLAPEKTGASTAGGVAGTLGIGAFILFVIASFIASCEDLIKSMS